MEVGEREPKNVIIVVVGGGAVLIKMFCLTIKNGPEAIRFRAIFFAI